MSDNAGQCCPRFDPAPWNEKELEWNNKRFVKDRVISFLHIPLNFGAVMRRQIAAIESAGAKPENMIILADENSLWGADVYIEVSKEIPGVNMAVISGKFLSKVFEGSFSNIKKWITEMHAFVHGRGAEPKQLLFYYTTCPKCAKKFGKNYVVILAKTG